MSGKESKWPQLPSRLCCNEIGGDGQEGQDDQNVQDEPRRIETAQTVHYRNGRFFASGRRGEGAPMRQVKIGAGQGFYGDVIGPALDLAELTDVQYLCFDTLAELTLAILHKDRQKDPSLGFAKDIAVTAKTLLPYVHEKGLKLITNAGGLNPEGARREVARVAKELGLTGLKIGVATGDDLFCRLDELQAAGADLSDLGSGRPLSAVRDRLLFANAYLGAAPIVEALRQGADVVITGRTTDTAQFLAPAMFELGWAPDDWDKLAQGVVLG